jgi:hypothetical protein
LVLFGSNLGTAEGIAHRIADDARSRGFAATVGPLDEHADALPRQGAVVIVTASYNGQPPDNAAKFCQKLRDPALPPDAFAGSSTASSNPPDPCPFYPRKRTSLGTVLMSAKCPERKWPASLNLIGAARLSRLAPPVP